MSESKKIIGIDLGTTNSVCAIMEGANPKIIINSEGFRTTPSIIAYTPKKELLIGQMAKRQIILNPINTFSCIKRFIGLKYDEVLEDIEKVSYKIKKDNNNKIRVHCPALEQDFTPEEISSEILKKLKLDANAYLNEDIFKAVITVPAYFNDSQRQATKDAGSLAGLNVVRILNEPTAAALAYGLKRDKNEIVLIFDLGGGTFDVSILEIGKEVLEVLSTSGNTHLGGDDFDQCLVNYIISDFEQKNKVNLYNDKHALQRIKEASEGAKIELSVVQSTIINLPFIHITEKNEILNLELSIDRNLFENIIKDLVEKCKEPLFKALEDSKLTPIDLNQVILVGGSTRIPMIRKLLSSIFNVPLNESINPDEAVAIGAAIQAGIIAGEIVDLILLDVTPLSLGVEVLGGMMSTVIPRNTSVPVQKSEIFSTSSDNQESAEINILQGEHKVAKHNRSLGVFELKGIPIMPKGKPSINVKFQIDVDGILSVSSREEMSGIEQSIKIKNDFLKNS
jgi:molecular chaperone DnaK